MSGRSPGAAIASIAGLTSFMGGLITSSRVAAGGAAPFAPQAPGFSPEVFQFGGVVVTNGTVRG